MYVTSRYLGTEIRGLRYLFYLLTEDDIRGQKKLGEGFSNLLDVFTRQLGDYPPVVQPFVGDERETTTHVMEKNWAPSEREIIRSTPGFLVISVDFTEFQPNKDDWIYISLREFMSEAGEVNIFGIRDAFEVIVEACRAGVNIFTTVHNYYAEQTGKKAVDSIELKPGLFGFGIDLKGIVAMLRPSTT